MTSLEDPFQQSRNRYTGHFSSPYLNVKLGDVNPNINEYAFNGYRIRGLDLILNTGYFGLSYAKGQVLRPIQGDPNYDAMFVDPDSSMLRINDVLNDTSFTTSLKNLYNFKID